MLKGKIDLYKDYAQPEVLKSTKESKRKVKTEELVANFGEPEPEHPAISPESIPTTEDGR